jgi:Flp pilus assembly CpaE family ATPase
LVRVLWYAVMRNRITAETAKTEPGRGSVVGFLGAKGGVRTTTVACHFAMEVRRQSSKPALVIERDASTSLAAFLMTKECQYTLLDACQSLYRLDEELWRRLFSSEGSVDLIPSPALTSSDLLPEINELFFVTNNDLPSLYLTSRQLNKLTDLGVRSEQLDLIINRTSLGRWT